MILFLFACADPPLLDKVADAYGGSLVDEASPGLGLFISIAAIIAEPCDQDTVDAYVLTGEGNRALRVTTPQVELAEDGTHTYSYGTVVFGTDGGDLTLTSDANRKAWTARFGGADAVFTANYSLSDCQADVAGGPATLASIAGTGTRTRADEVAEEVAITGGGDSVLTWSPSTAPVPTAGEVTWHVTDEKHELALDGADTIDGVTREWPGQASGSGWATEVKYELP